MKINQYRAQLGRFPIALDIIANVLKYREDLKSKKKDLLLYKAFVSNENLSAKIGRIIWEYKCSHIQQLHAGIPLDYSNRKYVLKCLESQYHSFWSEKIRHEPKMRTYIQFKCMFGFEHYHRIELYRKAKLRRVHII